MIHKLSIHNIILVENATLTLKSGFNVLSGETGAGKSAVLAALNLLSGCRADTELLREGAEKGVVEGLFDISGNQEVATFLENAGIEHSDDEELIIRREITSSGRARIFINNQSVQLSLLRAVGSCLIESVGQHASQRLLDLDQHRTILDTFGEHTKLLNTFRTLWEEESTLKARLNTMRADEAKRLRNIEICRDELAELQEAAMKEGEEEELFSEYSLLSNAEERHNNAHTLSTALSGERGIIGLLTQQQRHFDLLAKLDNTLLEAAEGYKTAVVELSEVAYTLQHYLAGIDCSPEKLNYLNDRLTLINKMKRKYGPTIADVHAYHAATEEKLDALENADSIIDELINKITTIETQCHAAAQALTAARTKAARQLEKNVVKHLRELNMADAQFHVDCSPQKRTLHGDDKIEFFLAPNIGERQLPVRECASGGELSRLMLAIQTLLAGKEQTPTLIFDEIDANIGGATASIVGEKLRAIGARHQVICITHFPQVAAQAEHHIQISKKTHRGRTITLVQELDKESIELELNRMRGYSLTRSNT